MPLERCRNPQHPPGCRLLWNYPTECKFCKAEGRITRVIAYGCDRTAVYFLPWEDGGGAHVHNGGPGEGDDYLEMLQQAAKKSDFDAIKYLEQMPNVLSRIIDRPDIHGWTPLFFAAREGHANFIEKLVRLGGTISIPDENGRTPFIVAAMHDHADAIKTLARLGADCHHQVDGRTALDYATKMKSPEAVVALLELGGDIPDMQERVREAVRMIVSGLRPDQQYNREETIAALHNLGADFECKNNDGCRLIHLVAKAGSWTAMDAIAKCGVDLEAKCDLGFTAMHWAAHGGDWRVIEVLCKHGAMVNSKDKNGETPLDWAHNKDNHYAIRELEKRGGKRKREQ